MKKATLLQMLLQDHVKMKRYFKQLCKKKWKIQLNYTTPTRIQLNKTDSRNRP